MQLFLATITSYLSLHLQKLEIKDYLLVAASEEKNAKWMILLTLCTP